MACPTHASNCRHHAVIPCLGCCEAPCHDSSTARCLASDNMDSTSWQGNRLNIPMGVLDRGRVEGGRILAVLCGVALPVERTSTACYLTTLSVYIHQSEGQIHVASCISDGASKATSMTVGIASNFPQRARLVRDLLYTWSFQNPPTHRMIAKLLGFKHAPCDTLKAKLGPV